MKKIFILVVSFAVGLGLGFSKEQLRVYTVVKGDTLSQIAQKFYNKPLQWGKIHSCNKFIKDSHWIFPGDELVIPVDVLEKEEVAEKKSGEESEKIVEKKLEEEKAIEKELKEEITEKELEKEEVVEKELEKENEKIVEKKSEEKIMEKELEEDDEITEKELEKEEVSSATPVHSAVIAKKESEKKVEENAVITSEDWEFDGYISSEKDRKIIIGQGDIVFLDLGKEQNVKPFDKYTIYRNDRKIIHPKTDESLGDLVRKIGVLEISTDIQNNTCTAKIIMSREPILVGDMIKKQPQ
ncbi:MAG: LysM peptidoglycan-binding domain-containing protein [Elusimicrobiota bacterium]